MDSAACIQLERNSKSICVKKTKWVREDRVLWQKSVRDFVLWVKWWEVWQDLDEGRHPDCLSLNIYIYIYLCIEVGRRGT